MEKQDGTEEVERFEEAQEIKERLKLFLTLVLSGLAGINIVILQGFISGGKLDIPSTISVYALAIAIPMLSLSIVKLNVASPPVLLNSMRNLIALILGIVSSLVGLSAAFYHISWIACVIFVACSVAACLLYLQKEVGEPIEEEVEEIE